MSPNPASRSAAPRQLARAAALLRTGAFALAALGAAAAGTLYFHCGCSIVWPMREQWPAPAAAAPPAAPPRLVLVLGGGGTRGFAHVGVIKALEAAGVQPDLVVGTSVGAVVGALYAAGHDASSLERIARALGDDTLCGWTWPRMGLHSREPLRRFVNAQLRSPLMEQFPRRFVAVATDLASGQAVAFGRGEAARAVQASASVPGYFVPVRIDGRDFVDGSLVAPVAVDVARRLGARIVVAVDVSHRPGERERSDLVDVLSQAFMASAHAQGQREVAGADVLIRPELPAAGDKGSADALIAAGERAARAALPQIGALLAVGR